MNSSYHSTNYVKSSTTHQDLQTYNDYGVNPPYNDVHLSIYPTFGGVGVPNLQHNLPRNEINDCDYFSLMNAYKTPNFCSQKWSSRSGFQN